MKRIHLLAFILILPFSLKCQTWLRIFQSTLNSHSDYVIENYDKGYVLVGDINYKYLWMIKTDINGNMLWNKKFGKGSIGYDFIPVNIEQTNDHGYIIGANTSKYSTNDACILKLNSCGEVQWCNVIYTPGFAYDYGGQVKPTSDGGYIFYRLDQKYNTNRSNLYKFNSVGQLLWHQQIASDSLEFGEDVSNLIVDSTGILLNGNCYYPDPGQTIGVERFYLVKTDTSGQKLWGTVYGDSSYYYGENYTSLVSLHGDYYAFGDHFDTASSHFFPPLIKVLKNGIPSYNHDIFNNSSGGISTAAWLNDTIIILGGILLLNSNTSQVIMLKADTLGNFSSVVPFLQISNYLMNTYKTFDKKFVSTGFMWQTNKNVIYLIKVNSDLQYDTLYTHPFTYDSLCSHPIVSDTIDPDCGLIVNVEEPFSKPETHQLKVFPNPTTTQISIVFPQYLMVENNSGVIKTTTVYHQWKSTFLEVYNLNGERLFQKEIPKDQTRLELDVSSWPKGMYLLRLIYNKQTVAGEKVIIK